MRECIPQEMLILKKYTLVIVTGNLKGAATDANVFINLFGEKVGFILFGCCLLFV